MKRIFYVFVSLKKNIKERKKKRSTIEMSSAKMWTGSGSRGANKRRIPYFTLELSQPLITINVDRVKGHV